MAPGARGLGGLRLSEPLLRRLVLDHNRHRRIHPEALRSETEEFIAGYGSALFRVQSVNAWTRADFGPSDPDTNAQLANILVRMDLCDEYEELLNRIPSLGPPAVSAMYEVLEQVSERDERRRPILQQAKQLLGRILLERQLRARARTRAKPSALTNAQGGTTEPDVVVSTKPRPDNFAGLQRELLTGTAFLERGGEPPDKGEDD